MKKTDFYKQFKGTNSQVLDFAGEVSVPKKISAKAEIIISTLAGVKDGWDMTLAQLQDAVFQRRGTKADWNSSGSFDEADLITVSDLKQSIVEVFFNKRESKYWDNSMLEVFALKNGEIVLRKVPFVEGLLKAKEPKKAKKKAVSLLADLVDLYERKGDKYSSEDLKALEGLIEKIGGDDVEFVGGDVVESVA